MKPGDKIEYNKTSINLLLPKCIPTIAYLNGRKYLFRKESLENIMKTLSRIYDVEIRFDSNKLPKEYFYGNDS